MLRYLGPVLITGLPFDFFFFFYFDRLGFFLAPFVSKAYPFMGFGLKSFFNGFGPTIPFFLVMRLSLLLYFLSSLTYYATLGLSTVL